MISRHQAIAPPQQQPDNSLAWVLAAMPVVSILLIWALLIAQVDIGTTTVALVLLGVSYVLILIDSQLLKLRAYNVPVAWALLAIPVYLIKRVRVTGQSYALPVAWTVALVGYFAGALVLGTYYGPFQLDGDRIQLAIKAEVDADFMTISQVSCPIGNHNFLNGETVDCEVKDTTARLIERVTVRRHGDVTWIPVGAPTPLSNRAVVSRTEWDSVCMEGFGDACDCAYDRLAATGFDLRPDVALLSNQQLPSVTVAKTLKACG